MRAEADRIAMMASTAAMPLAEGLPARPSTIEMWREVAAAARAFDAWIWEAQSQEAPLTPGEAAVLVAATPLTSEMSLGSLAVASDLAAPAKEPDAVLLVSRMEGLARTASTVARSLEPLAICDAPDRRMEMSYAPASPDCEDLDRRRAAAAGCGH